MCPLANGLGFLCAQKSVPPVLITHGGVQHESGETGKGNY